MINYNINKQGLDNAIKTLNPTWLDRAKTRTINFQNKGKYDESSSIWSEIKTIYMRLQHYKCAFCEKRLSGEEIGKIEHDVEHFRPKKKIANWKYPSKLNDIKITKVNGSQKGHYLLAYNPFNYTTSCKPCNSILKGNKFPIKNQYDLVATSSLQLIRNEEPYLIYPIGDFDDNPEDLFYFVGIHPVTKSLDQHKSNRARITIEFFKLDDRNQRKHLFIQRAETILALYRIMEEVRTTNAVNEEDAKEFANRTAKHAPHSNCARSFMNVYKTDRDEASKLFRDTQKYFNSVSK